MTVLLYPGSIRPNVARSARSLAPAMLPPSPPSPPTTGPTGIETAAELDFDIEKGPADPSPVRWSSLAGATQNRSRARLESNHGYQ